MRDEPTDDWFDRACRWVLLCTNKASLELELDLFAIVVPEDWCSSQAAWKVRAVGALDVTRGTHSIASTIAAFFHVAVVTAVRNEVPVWPVQYVREENINPTVEPSARPRARCTATLAHRVPELFV